MHMLSLVIDNNPYWINGREQNGCGNDFMINLHKSMRLGRYRTLDPWISSQTPICSQARYRLLYAARRFIEFIKQVAEEIKCEACPAFIFRKKFSKFNYTGAQMLDSICYMTLKLLWIYFAIYICDVIRLLIHKVTKICKPLVVYWFYFFQTLHTISSKKSEIKIEGIESPKIYAHSAFIRLNMVPGNPSFFLLSQILSMTELAKP